MPGAYSVTDHPVPPGRTTGCAPAGRTSHLSAAQAFRASPARWRHLHVRRQRFRCGAGHPPQYQHHRRSAGQPPRPARQRGGRRVLARNSGARLQDDRQDMANGTASASGRGGSRGAARWWREAGDTVELGAGRPPAAAGSRRDAGNDRPPAGGCAGLFVAGGMVEVRGGRRAGRARCGRVPRGVRAAGAAPARGDHRDDMAGFDGAPPARRAVRGVQSGSCAAGTG